MQLVLPVEDRAHAVTIPMQLKSPVEMCKHPGCAGIIRTGEEGVELSHLLPMTFRQQRS